MQARPHPQTDNVKVSPTKNRRPERDQRLCIYAESTISERPRRYGTYRHAAQSQENQTIFGIGVVSDVVRFTCTRPAPECTSTFFSVTVRSASGARSLSVMVAGDFTATRASEPKSMPALAHRPSAACNDSAKPSFRITRSAGTPYACSATQRTFSTRAMPLWLCGSAGMEPFVTASTNASSCGASASPPSRYRLPMIGSRNSSSLAVSLSAGI